MIDRKSYEAYGDECVSEMLRDEPTLCPFCDTESLVADGYWPGDNVRYVFCVSHCSNCGARWQEQFELTLAEVITEPEFFYDDKNAEAEEEVIGDQVIKTDAGSIFVPGVFMKDVDCVKLLRSSPIFPYWVLGEKPLNYDELDEHFGHAAVRWAESMRYTQPVA